MKGLVEKESKVAKDAEKLGVKVKPATPMGEMFRETKEVVKTAEQCGVENTKKGMSFAEQHAFFVTNREISLAKTEEVFSSMGNALPPINWKHVLCGEIKRKKLKGFHHARNYKEKIYKITKGPNADGLYGAYYKVGKERKYSTFFPDSWDRSKLLEKVKEAYGNITKELEYGVYGITSEGIEIGFFFAKDEAGSIFVNSVYPILEKTL
jgi:hypothetical protein